MVEVYYKNVIYLLVHGYLKQKNDRTSAVVLQRFFSLHPFIPFVVVVVVTKNENRTPYWKGTLFHCKYQNLEFSGHRHSSS